MACVRTGWTGEVRLALARAPPRISSPIPTSRRAFGQRPHRPHMPMSERGLPVSERWRYI